jgi:hypothetical protein
MQLISRSSQRRSMGQSLAEFALVLPLFIAVIGGVVQFGTLFWAQNTLTQVVRDAGRWEATQQTKPCGTGLLPDGVTTGAAALGTQANTIAGNSSLLGYTTSEWGTPAVYSTDLQVQGVPNTEGIAVAWVADSDPPPAVGCPPSDNTRVWHVTIRINHSIPIFFPGMQYLPGLGTCTSSGCNIVLSSTAQFRMEPAPAP